MDRQVLNDTTSCFDALGHVGCGRDKAEFESSWKAVENITMGWNLGNTLDSTGARIPKGSVEAYETAWGNPVTTKEAIIAVKEAGFNAVRVPVTWRYHFDENAKIDKAWFDRVQEVVDYVISLDMYCIVNIHHDGGSGGWVHASTANYAEQGDTFAKLWEQIAKRFKSYGEKLMFESINEILDDDNRWGYPCADATQGLALYTQRFVDTVRATGGNNSTRNLIIMTYAGSAGNAISDFIMPTDTVEDHLILEIHDYGPTEFCWHGSAPHSVNYWGSKADLQKMDAFFEDTLARAEKLGIPLIIGEWGSQFKTNDDDRAKHAEYFLSKAEEYGFATFWWDCGDFAIIDRKRCVPSHPKITDAMREVINKRR